MTDQLQSGPHPDPELLNAFIEGVLPEDERRGCVLHFAECARCREIVFLAQPPQSLPAIVPVKQHWYLQLRALTGAIAACVLIVAVLLYKREPTPPTSPATRAERSVPAAKPVPAAPVATRGSDAEPTAAKSTAQARRKFKLLAPAIKLESAKAEPPASAPVPAARALSAAPPALPPADGVVGGSASQPAVTPAQPPTAPKIQRDTATESQAPLNDQKAMNSLAAPALPRFATSASSSGIKGSVADPSGAAISGARVTVRAMTGNAHDATQTDPAGEFSIAGLPAGRYEVQIESPGFVRYSSQLELKANEPALLASTLNIGSAAQSVTIAGASPAIDTEAQTIRSETLSGKRPFAIRVTSGTRVLALDAAGALYFSHNQGKHWKAIKPKWQGKVRQLIVVSPDPAPLFQLTTESGAVWSSTDGTHWHREKR